MEKFFEFKLKNKNTKNFSNQFLPLSLEYLADAERIEYKNRSLKTNYLIDITHNLLLKYYFKKENTFNLSSLILKEKYGYQYNYYVGYLLEKNIIELKKKHIKGKNSRIYKLNESIINDEVKRFKNYDKVLLKKYNKVRSHLINSNSDLINSDIKKKLVEDLFSVKIDCVKSLSFLDSLIQKRDIYQKNKYSVESINCKHIFYHFDNFGRFHTNFTILKSFIRKNCLLIDDESTFEIDIENSQPLFLTKVLEKNLEFLDIQEYLLYKTLTYTGKFYQYLQEKLNITNRKIIKNLIYRVFFGKNFPNNFDKQFSIIFPTIYNFIKKYKKDNGDYRLLSYELQKLESNFLFNIVIKKIWSQNSEIKIITCHDSLICRHSDKMVVEKIFKESLRTEFNMI